MNTQHETDTGPTFGQDTKAAFTGLVLGAVVLLLIVLGIVRWTNSIYASHETPAATTTK